MFDFLKKKLKSWLGKSKPATAKKQGKSKTSKSKPAKVKKIKPLKKSTKPVKIKPLPIEQIPEPLIEETKERKIGTEIWGEIKESAEKLEEEKQGFFDFLKKKIDDKNFQEMFNDLEMILLENNVALEVVQKIKQNLKDKLLGKVFSDIDMPSKIKQSIDDVLIEKDFLGEVRKILAVKKPAVIAFVGINGSGKTTTIAKVANLLKNHGYSVCLAAADTFRAASIEQLEQHAQALKVPIIKREYGSDPASVGFDAVNYAKKHSLDIVLIDTAGRMNTKDSLMKEMEKITRVTKADMKIFIGEAITGNDATQQAKDFNNAINLDGIILSKADVDEKGGAFLSVSYVTKKPIFFLGTGQKYQDLKPFKKVEIIQSLGLE